MKQRKLASTKEVVCDSILQDLMVEVRRSSRLL